MGLNYGVSKFYVYTYTHAYIHMPMLGIPYVCVCVCVCAYICTYALTCMHTYVSFTIILAIYAYKVAKTHRMP